MTFMGIDREIVSTIILQLSQIQEGQLSVTGESMCISTGKPFIGVNLPSKSVSN